MKHNKLTFNINYSLWLFALSFLISIVGFAQPTQNNILSFPPYYYQFLNIPPLQPLNAPGGQSGFFFDNYDETPAKFCHNAFQDINGEVAFFVVDDKVYNKDGYAFIDNQLIDNNGFPYKGYSEIMIIPDPGNCNRYYIFTTFTLGDASAESTDSLESPETQSEIIPGYAILDLGLTDSNFPNMVGGLVQVTQGQYFNTIFDLPFSNNPNISSNGTHSYASTELNPVTNERFIFTLTEGRILRYRLNAAGLTFDGEIASATISNFSWSASGIVKAEMEVIKLANGNYRMALAGDINPIGSTNLAIRSIVIFELNQNGIEIGNPEIIQYSSGGNGTPLANNFSTEVSIHGLEFSPGGNYLYINRTKTTAFPATLEVYQIGSGLQPPNIPSLNTVGNTHEEFRYSQIELGKDGKLYFANSNNLATYSNPNNPFSSPSQWNNTALPLTNYNLVGSITSPSENLWSYILPDQIDGMDYTAHFNATPECCLEFSSYSISSDNNSHEYSGTHTWSDGNNTIGTGNLSSPITIKDLLIIKSGANITINNMRFEFAPGARLIVENGAKLTINNGTTLTVYDDCGGTGLMWQGVEVWGTGTNSFQPLTSGEFIANNSIIEHALEGAINYRRPIPIGTGTTLPPFNAHNGGIIKTNTTTFRNNRNDVIFNPYSSMLNGNRINDRSFFINTTFTTDNSLNNALLNPVIIHVIMNDVMGINFSGCKFNNTAPSGIYPYLSRGTGILSFNTKFTVREQCLNPLSNPCTNMNKSVFTNLTMGIRATDMNASTTVQIVNSIFDDNWRGVYLAGMEFPNVSDNNFDVGMMSAFPPSSNTASYGLYLDNCKFYKVENNDFTTTHFGFLGVYVNNSGFDDNEIYNNTFSNLFVASQAAQRNGNGIGNTNSGVGLVFKCNSYETISHYDILVSSGRIKTAQGFCTPNQLAPANNRFSYTATGDFWMQSSPIVQDIVTYQYNALQNGFNLEPKPFPFINNTNTFPTACPGLINFHPTTSCPKRIQRTRAQLTAALGGLRLILDSLNNLIDAGDTQALLAFMATNSNGDVKDALLAASPYLSDEVLLAYLASNPPSGHLQQVLLANSPLSADVDEALADMILPKGISNQIANAQTGESAMELLQQEISFYQSEFQRTENDLIRDLLFDEVTNDGFALVEDYLMQQPIRTNEQEQLLALVRIANEDVLGAQQQLDVLDNDPINTKFCELHNVVVAYMPTPERENTLLTDSTKAQTIGQVADATPLCQSGTNAQALLENVGIRNPYNEVIEIVEPQTGNNLRLGSSNNETNTTSTKKDVVILYPNPANGQVTIAHNLETKNGTVSLEVMDVMGRVLMNKTINNTNNQIDINQLSSGLYFYNVLQNDKMVQSGKLVVE
ncbi:MAG: T9SS type A sorting domain-containing protein [Vicingaceae bacterium]|nr:T9SS type A sorting domain-containing protein [Vicingaceae bacterium]